MSSIDIIFKGAKELTKRTSQVRRADGQLNKALLSALNIIAVQAKKVHIFENQSGKLQASIDTEARGLVGKVFVPIKGPLGVAYAGWIHNGKRRAAKGEDGVVTWNNGNGDPFLNNAYEVKKNVFLEDYKSKVYKTYKDLITRGLR